MITTILVQLVASLLGLCPAQASGELRVLVESGQVAPGTTGVFRAFLTAAGIDPRISGDNITFMATTDRGGGSTRSWTAR